MTPDDLKYTKDHEWVRILPDGTAQFGITDFAQDALGDIVQQFSGRVAIQDLRLQLLLESLQDAFGKLGRVAAAIRRGVHTSS